ncbi:MAG TPA: polysaccharide biosynthesis/export family protein [Bacteroidales bacterium]|nr:polysaccharide biosynthesis/export family protein [Bacteroidales bacterium]HRW86638.1 polysaccharide biosynthesis/export family protein [Bacteroidales bacterium]
MRNHNILLTTVLLILTSCTTQQKLAYLSNLPETGGEENFIIDIPDYRIQYRDILYITIKAMTPDGTINDFLLSHTGTGATYTQGEAGQYLFGYDVNSKGDIILPVLGKLHVEGLSVEQARELIEHKANEHFKNPTAECKLLSFKFTVLGEVRSPGTYINYNNYLTVLEAVGRAGGITDYGRRDKLLVIRPTGEGTRTYSLNLQDKNILTSEAYFLLPNDVVIVEPESKKIFNLNLPTYSFIITTAASLLTSTLLLINYFGKE